MEGFTEVLMYGLVAGSLYALAAIGYSLVYSLLGFVNFAHGELLTLGAYLFLIISGGALTVSSFIAGALAAVAIGLVSVVVGMALLAPARKQSRMAALVVAIGCSIAIQNTLILLMSPEARPFPVWDGSKTPIFLGLNSLNLVSLFSVLLILLFLWSFFFKRTRMGLEIRACASDRTAAALWGLRIRKSYALVFFLSGLLAAVAGIGIAMDAQLVTPLFGFAFGLRAFVASVIGGLTSLKGAVAGAFLLGLVENLIGFILIVNSELTFLSAFITKDVIALTLLVLVLLIRPEGIFTKPVEARP